jgi:hypothetical protein
MDLVLVGKSTPGAVGAGIYDPNNPFMTLTINNFKKTSYGIRIRICTERP